MLDLFLGAARFGLMFDKVHAKDHCKAEAMYGDSAVETRLSEWSP